MSRFAPVAPHHILDELLTQDKYAFGRYHLFLAHHTTEKAQEFKDLISWSAGVWSTPMIIIMDNSLVELGGAVDLDMMLEATSACNPFWNYVIPVLPDVMGDGKNTIEATSLAYETWCNKFSDGTEFMLVAQGFNWRDFTNLVNYFFIENSYPLIRWVGIPRKLVETLERKSRRSAIEYVNMVAPHIKIHLLGFSDDVVDDLKCARLNIKNISGIDSAVPVRHKGIFTPTCFTPPRNGSTWWEHGRVTDETISNIKNVRKWLGEN